MALRRLCPPLPVIADCQPPLTVGVLLLPNPDITAISRFPDVLALESVSTRDVPPAVARAPFWTSVGPAARAGWGGGTTTRMAAAATARATAPPRRREALMRPASRPAHQ